MFLEAVTVCVNYSDFLSHALPFNKQVFDKILVVTTPDDLETQKVCRFHDVEYLTSTCLYDKGMRFAKHNMINYGLSKLSQRDWVCHIDADIVLPPKSGFFIRNSNLDSRCIYGIDRLEMIGLDNWANFISNPLEIYEGNVFLRTDKFKVLTRVYSKSKNYCPIGFFQLWHPDRSEIREYPHSNENAAKADMMHPQRWVDRDRRLLPTVVGFHLETGKDGEPATMGINWAGRQTDPFVIGNTKKSY